MSDVLPPICNGVVQRSSSRLGEGGAFIASTEWLATQGPDSWTLDPVEALVFCGDARMTGYERAAAAAQALNAATRTVHHHACTRVQARPAKEPPMPARVLDRRTSAGQAEDWHGRAPNCGIL